MLFSKRFSSTQSYGGGILRDEVLSMLKCCLVLENVSKKPHIGISPKKNI